MEVLNAAQDIIDSRGYVQVCLINVSLKIIFIAQKCVTEEIHVFCVMFFSYIECFGAFGFNCSEPCTNDYFGYQCKNQCNCQNHEICNKFFGCQTISEFL